MQTSYLDNKRTYEIETACNSDVVFKKDVTYSKIARKTHKGSTGEVNTEKVLKLLHKE